MDRTQIFKISKALADETRLRVFEAIAAQDGINCGELVSREHITPGTVSHHLKVLAEAGLIECHRNGQFVHSKAIPRTLRDYTRALAQLGAMRK